MKKYNAICIDPPWSYGTMKSRTKAHRGGNPQSHYPTMTLEEIRDLPIDQLADDCSCLFLWVTNPKIKLGLDLIPAWGYTYQTIVTWVKVNLDGSLNKGGLGFYFRGATEHMIFATKGGFSIPTHKRLPNVFFAPKSEHSKKPDKAYEIIEEVTMGLRLEMFARSTRPNWDVWGNEVESNLILRPTNNESFHLSRSL